MILALNEANVILFMVDCKNGLSTLDDDFSNVIRQIKKDIILVANKADNYELELNSNEFYELGLKEVPIVPISSISGSGTGELLDLVVSKLEINTSEKDISLPRISILGRPNVGKSSFVNAILGEERNIVTDISGTTRDSIDTKYNLFSLWNFFVLLFIFES